MKFFLLIILFLLGISPVSFSQILINEVQTSNKNTLADEDGDFEDWIELFNPGSAAVNILNYGLSDDQTDLYKWRFPSITMEPNGRLLVFASGKNRKPIVNHWEAAVFAQDNWHYFLGTQNPPTDWKEIGFNDSNWLEGEGGIGYGDNDDGTVIAPVISVFMRRTFTIPDVSAIASSVLSMDYDDGFVAYLNGIEIARANLSGYPPLYNEVTIADHEAQLYQGGTPEHFVVDSSLIQSLLVNGTNVLAVQTHNSSENSSDMTSSPFLFFGINNASTYFEPLPAWFPGSMALALHTNFKLQHSGETLSVTAPSGTVTDAKLISFSDLNHSHCRIPDGSPDWCISKVASPAQSNNSSTCFAGYTTQPVMNIAPGFYNQGQLISLSVPNTGGEIHYTLNGNIPKLTDPVFTLPIPVTNSLVLRARCFQTSGLLPGKVATATYIIGDYTYKFPVVSVSTDSMNLWNFLTGIYVMGPFAEPDFPYFGANFWQPWEKDCHVEYFGPMESRKFELDAGLSIHGGWSRAFDQKSFNIKTHTYYDSSNISFKLFGEKPITDFKSIILRNSGNDWMVTHMRDALMQRVMKNTFVDYMAYCPSVVYLNGKYWGIYNIRERNNKDFVEENHGIHADSIDMIESDGIVSAGNDQAFWQMVEYIKTHDMSVPQQFAIGSSWWNMKNFADYFIAETYYVNNDWIGDWTNNIKLWRERKQGSKWNYILWDTDFGLGYSSSYTENKLVNAMNPPMGTPHADIFRGMLENDGFRSYFINRYADLINTVYLPVNMKAMVQEMQDSIASEMPVAWQRWFGNSNYQEWLNNINDMKSFIGNRPTYARQHINSTFGLNGSVQAKLATSPASGGVIKINTIVPEPLPWTGIYFNGNPVTITAIAKPGYKFMYWLSNSYIELDTNRTLTLNLDHFDTFKAVFSGSPENATATISEVNYHSDSTSNSGDWVEVHNYGNIPLDISEWHLTDSWFYHDFTFPTGTILPAKGHIVVSEDTSLFHARYPGIPCIGPTGFGYSNNQESVSLLDIHLDTVATFRYYDSIPWLTAADGLGRTLELRAGSTDLNNPANWFVGCMGGSPGMAYQACNDDVLFSEINYNSADNADAGDWVELYNPGSSAVNLSGWKFSDSDDQHLFPIPQGTMLNGGDYLVLYGDKNKFESLFPLVSNKKGPYNFGLSGSGEPLRLFDNSGKLHFSVVYDDESPWPAEPDGQGFTLELADVNGVMCDGLSWFAGCPGGSPGEHYYTPCFTSLTEVTPTAFIVFPNPATTQLFILCKELENENALIQVSDALGRTVLEKQLVFAGTPSARLSVDGLKNGIYYMKISTENMQNPEVVRIVIAR